LPASLLDYRRCFDSIHDYGFEFISGLLKML